MSPCASLSLRVHTRGDNLSVAYISGLCHHSFSPVNGACIPLAGRQEYLKWAFQVALVGKNLPVDECTGTDSDCRVPAELGQESQASSCVEEWNSA